MSFDFSPSGMVSVAKCGDDKGHLKHVKAWLEANLHKI